MFVFFKQKTAYEMRISDWSSDVCSSDLEGLKQRASRLLAAPLLRSGRGRRAAPGEGPAFPTNKPPLPRPTSTPRAGRLTQTHNPAPPDRTSSLSTNRGSSRIVLGAPRVLKKTHTNM